MGLTVPPTVKLSSHFLVLVWYLSHCSPRSKFWQENLLQHAELTQAFSSTCKNDGPTTEIKLTQPLQQQKDKLA